MAPLNINSQDECGETVLHHACRAGSVDAVKALLAKGAKVTILDMHGQSPVIAATWSGQFKVLKLILDAAVTGGAHRMCDLVYVAINNYPLQVELTTWAGDLESLNRVLGGLNSGRVEEAVQQADERDTLLLLLAKMKETFIRARAPEKPLQDACEKMAVALIHKGVLSQVDAEERRIILKILFSIPVYDECVRAVLKMGLKSAYEEGQVLVWAVKRNDVAIINALDLVLELPDLMLFDSPRPPITPGFQAAQQGMVPAVSAQAGQSAMSKFSSPKV